MRDRNPPEGPPGEDQDGFIDPYRTPPREAPPRAEPSGDSAAPDPETRRPSPLGSLLGSGGLPPEPPDPDTVKRLGVLAGRFGLLLLATFLVAALPLPFSVAALGFAGWALVVGVQAVVMVVRARIRTAVLPALVIGVALTGLLFVSFLVSAALWPVQSARQDCLSSALTNAAQEQCEAEYAEEIESWLERVVPGAGSTPDEGPGDGSGDEAGEG